MPKMWAVEYWLDFLYRWEPYGAIVFDNKVEATLYLNTEIRPRYQWRKFRVVEVDIDDPIIRHRASDGRFSARNSRKLKR